MATGWHVERDGDLVELTEAELARMKGSPRLFRTNDGTPMVEWTWTDPDDGTVYTDGPRDATGDEIDALKRQERQAIDRQTALSNVLNSAPGTAVIDVLVEAGLIDIDDARESTWTHPDNR